MSLRKLISILVLYQYNLRVMHWKCSGSKFPYIHTLIDEYISKYNEFIDTIAEMNLALGGSIPSYNDINSDLSDINSDFEGFSININSNDYISGEDIYKGLNIIFNNTLILIENMYEDQPSWIKSNLDNIITYLNIEGKYKINSCLN